MALGIFRAVLALVCICAVNGVKDDLSAGVSAGESTFQKANPGDSCTAIVKGVQSCEWIKMLGGGMQANTGIVLMDGRKYVMKETSVPEQMKNLQSERKIVDQLMAAGFDKMPTYFTKAAAEHGLGKNFEAANRGTEILVMEFLEGWDIPAKLPSEDRADGEVRAAAFMIALDQMHQAKVSHCDLNPGNVMFKRAGLLSEVKIIDFGMSEVRWGMDGQCVASNAMPDLGTEGGAWLNIYSALSTGYGAGTIQGVCGMTRGRGCSPDKNKWKMVIQSATATVAQYQREHPAQVEEYPAQVDEYMPTPSNDKPSYWPSQEQKPSAVHWPSHDEEQKPTPAFEQPVPQAAQHEDDGIQLCPVGSIVISKTLSKPYGVCAMDKSFGQAPPLPCIAKISCDGVARDVTINNLDRTHKERSCPLCGLDQSR